MDPPGSWWSAVPAEYQTVLVISQHCCLVPNDLFSRSLFVQMKKPRQVGKRVIPSPQSRYSVPPRQEGTFRSSLMVSF